MNLEGKNLVVGNHDKGVEESKKKFLCDSIHARWNVQKEKKGGGSGRTSQKEDGHQRASSVCDHFESEKKGQPPFC